MLSNYGKKINIVHVMGRSGWAGGEVYLAEIAKRLDRNRYNLSVITSYWGVLNERLRDLGIDSYIIDMEKKFNIKSIIQMQKFFKEKKPDIIQSHGARTNFYVRTSVCFVKSPVVISTIHNSLYDYPIPWLKKKVYMIIDRATMGSADIILCVAKSLQDDIVRWSGVNISKIRVIHNGVDTDRFNPFKIDGETIKQKLGLKDKIVIGIIGRMTEQKGHKYFFEAVKTIKNTNPDRDIKALVVGDGSLKNDLEKYCEVLDIKKDVIFMGARADIPEILAGIDIYVLSSLSEGLPFSLLEAMAMQKPVVATNVSGVPEIIEDEVNGLLVPPRNSEKIAEAVLKLVNKEDMRDKIGKEARRYVEKSFNLDSMIEQIQLLYEGLLGD